MVVRAIVVAAAVGAVFWLLVAAGLIHFTR